MNRYICFIAMLLIAGCASRNPGIKIERYDDLYRLSITNNDEFSEVVKGLCSQRNYNEINLEDRSGVDTYISAVGTVPVYGRYVKGEIECIGGFESFYVVDSPRILDEYSEYTAKVIIYNSSSPIAYWGNEGDMKLTINDKYIGEIALGYYIEMAMIPGVYKFTLSHKDLFVIEDEKELTLNKGINVIEMYSTFAGNELRPVKVAHEEIKAEYKNYITDMREKAK